MRVSPPLLEQGRSYLEGLKVPEARASAEFLLAHVLQMSRGEVQVDWGRRESLAQKRRFWSLLKKRGRRSPLAHLTGTQPFFDFEILCGPGALIPRPETEELVFETLKIFKGRQKDVLSFLEIGAGTGAISLALARHFTNSRVVAVEKSARARSLAEKNIAAHPDLSKRVSLIAADLFKEWSFASSSFDLIISNPPYIPTGEISALEREVLREPRLALDGGLDGCRHLSAIIKQAPLYLKPSGVLALEIGRGQGARVKRLIEKSGLESVRILRDASGLNRFAFAVKKVASHGSV
jgi:release factor glutamine methyltransferase